MDQEASAIPSFRETPDVTVKNFPSTKLLQSLSRVQNSSSISNFQFGFKLMLGSCYTREKRIVLLGPHQ